MTIPHRLIALALAVSGGAALAKLPAPSDEAKAKAAESSAKSAHAGKLDGYKLCLAMDRVAAGYQANARKAGKAAPVPAETPACADPGPFVHTPPGGASAAAAPAAASAAKLAAAPAPAKK